MSEAKAKVLWGGSKYSRCYHSQGMIRNYQPDLYCTVDSAHCTGISDIRFPDNEEDGIEMAGVGADEQMMLVIAHTGLTTYMTSSTVVTTHSEIL